jgi:hypothetical protein
MLKRRFALILLLISAQLACKPESIRKAAKAADDMAITISVSIDTKRSLAASGMLTPEEEIPLTLGLQKVNSSVKAFHLQVKNTKELDQASKTLLLGLFSGIVDSVAELNQTGVLGIKNPEAKTKITTILAGFQISMSMIQVALGT